jgi:NO-binding membrane sensor protein with MHYT domain
MQGSHDWSLVMSSMVVAVLASFVAIEFAGRMREQSTRWVAWLAAGAVSMGSGVWSMHFVGMSDFQLPIAITYDLALTFLTWLAAVAVSGLALFLVARARLTAVNVLLGAIAMGAGICAMRHGGMWAMRMTPGIGYDPVWPGLSITVAVGASAAALLIVSRMRSVRSWRDIGLRWALPAGLTLDSGIARAPADGDTAQMLMPRAAARSTQEVCSEDGRGWDDPLPAAG